MNQPCIPPDDLGRVLGLPPDSPERLHLDACPRCRAGLLTYREFLEDRSIPPGADPRDAGTRLRAAFREAAGAGAPPSPSRTAPAPFTSRLRQRLRGLGHHLGRPLVLVPTAAAVLLAIGLYTGYERFRPGTGPDQLRGAESPGQTGLAPVSLLEVRPHGMDGVELAWRSVPGVTSYEVVIMGDDLVDLARVPVARDTSCVVRWADLRPGPSPGTLLGWQVLGLHDASPIARSPIGTLRVP